LYGRWVPMRRIPMPILVVVGWCGLVACSGDAESDDSAIGTTSAADGGGNGDAPPDSGADPGGSEAGGDGGGQYVCGETSPDDPLGILALHNQVRRDATPVPDPPLPEMYWDEELAASAQAWADGCRFEHSQSGENLYASTGPIDACDAVESWASEAAYYDYGSGNCADGEICGHYTQIVWRDTVELGCAVAECPSLPPVFDEEGLFWVCHYNPSGNYVGEHPY